jgi:DNA mismatch repair ATPase MutS
VETPAVDLQILALLLERLEGEAFTSPKLKQVRARLEVRGLPASKRIARLKRWVEMLDSSEHLFLRVVNPVVLWKEQLAMAVEAWRVESGPFIHTWISAVAEFEALSSFASLAFERPAWTFPNLLETSAPHFDAKDLRHPLIAPSKCVPNDVAIGGDTRVLIVSGSNMSGKSTLLRAIGLNAVLGWAGAPVAANSMHISSIRVGASIRVLDSLQDGRSRFYSEILRLRQIVDLAGSGAGVLFLLDEVLSGTNSHDRRIGAAAVIRALVAREAIGLVTTHDLALATLDQDRSLGIVNVHFDDEIENGRIEFDYRLRPGVVVRSNALELMRAVGLQV